MRLKAILATAILAIPPMLTARRIAAVFLALIATGVGPVQGSFLDGKEITLRWAYPGGVVASTTFTVDSRNGVVEVPEFPSGGGPVSIDVQDQDDNRATFLIRWISNGAVSMMNFLEFTNLPPYSAVFLGEIEWVGVGECDLRRFPNSFAFHVGAYPGLNWPGLFVRIDLLRANLRIERSTTPTGFVLRASGRPGHDYRLDATENLAVGDWHPIASFTMPVTGLTNITDSVTEASQKLYRVTKVPTPRQCEFDENANASTMQGDDRFGNALTGTNAGITITNQP